MGQLHSIREYFVLNTPPGATAHWFLTEALRQPNRYMHPCQLRIPSQVTVGAAQAWYTACPLVSQSKPATQHPTPTPTTYTTSLTMVQHAQQTSQCIQSRSLLALKITVYA